MSRFPKNHDYIYFDKLIRSAKMQSVLSFIYAAYNADKNYPNDDIQYKQDLQDRVVNAYKLFNIGGAGTYSGSTSQFQSQYTIGHEMCIWYNSSLRLTKFARKVAQNELTIRQYFDRIFLNYVQPVKQSNIHILYSILSYMKDNNTKTIQKDKIPLALGTDCANDMVNAVCHFLEGTNYFSFKDPVLEYIYDTSIEQLMNKCNLTYVGKEGYIKAQTDFVENDDEEKYIKYITSLKDENLDLTEDELANILKDMYNTGDKVVNIHLFGIKYGELIRDKGYKVNNIISKAGIKSSYFAELNKGINLSSYVKIKKYKEAKEQCDNFNDMLTTNDYNGAYNKIFYGAPGCGKSYYVKHSLLPSLNIIDDEEHAVRTTFYQDYSNTDFVGQILPKIVNNDVTYEFTPGPFALALKNALKHKNESTVLIIEEINRGNAASIFGDIFQLLDRDKDGRSEYEINHVNLQKYIKDELGIELSKIYIPSNLYIIGTMNTSDQNVFTLDTAFKRRWKFEKVKNEFNGNAHDNWIVPGTDGVTWENLVTGINKYIVENADELMNEDKQIGVYFIDENGLAEQQVDANNPDKVKEFAYKILEYLWDDVAKFTDKQKWFNSDIKTLDQLIESYLDKANENKALEVFGNDLNELINKKSN